MNLSILRAGFLTSVQDLGRAGWRASGVSVGGALDAFALRVANLLVGNQESAAGLEIALGNFRAQFHDDRLVAWCGGEFDVRIGSTILAAGHVAALRAGEELVINQSKIGSRAWLAISGGIDVPLVLGSRSTDLRANFGGLDGRALRDGDEIPLRNHPRSATAATVQRIFPWSAPREWSSTAKQNPVLRVVRGKDVDLFDESVFEIFLSERFVVHADSDRMGVRLEGAELRRQENVDLVSEAVAPGTIQVPPSGNPILLLGDCQTIGGYPKIAHVITVDLSLAAQLRPGDRFRFQEISLDDAHELLLDREKDFVRFKVGLQLQSR
ncbi:MAG: antagonist of KipI [Verrucomicrobiota bacterium]|jgi:antagonist of KipI